MSTQQKDVKKKKSYTFLVKRNPVRFYSRSCRSCNAARELRRGTIKLIKNKLRKAPRAVLIT